MRLALTCLVLGLGLLAACGGSGGEDGNTNGVFTLEWSGTVGDIENGFGANAVHPDIMVGDAYVARLTYSPSMFGGSTPIAEGETFDVVEPDVMIQYQFASGVTFERPATGFSVRAGAVDDIRIFSNAEWMLRLVDPGQTVFDLPLPVFEGVNGTFVQQQGEYQAASGGTLRIPGLSLAAQRDIELSADAFSVAKD